MSENTFCIVALRLAFPSPAKRGEGSGVGVPVKITQPTCVKAAFAIAQSSTKLRTKSQWGKPT
jgi:hypothetical protein